MTQAQVPAGPLADVTEDLGVPYEGTARVDPRTKDLAQRILPGEIAIIDHKDLDRTAAEALVRARVGGVLNVAPFVSGRYPNIGALLVAAAGIPMVDRCGKELFEIADGAAIRVAAGVVYADGQAICHGNVQSMDSLEEQIQGAKETIGVELEKFAENTLEYMLRERDIILEGIKLPHTDVDFDDRHVLVVVRGYDYREDLKALRSYIRDFKPILIGVDGGADALTEEGFTPDIIIGDFDSVSNTTLSCGAELIVHGYADGRAPGAERLDGLGVDYTVWATQGTSEDIAMLMAYELGAELIVAVGTHASLVEFLDKGRPGMASTFLTRLRVGPTLVDAKGVNKLYGVQIRKREVVLLILAALFAMLAVIWISDPFQLFLEGLWMEITDLFDFQD